MSDSTHLLLPYIDAAQAQKHVTHNEALRVLDAVTQLSALARDVNAPPGSPAEGARYLLGAAPTGAFTGHAGAVATWQDGAWRFLTPRAGWLAHVEADNSLRLFDGAQWRLASDALKTIDNLVGLGVGTASDATNALAAKLAAALFTARAPGEGGSGDLRLKLNKSAAGNVVSQLYQTNFSGRAETGLVGDDHFRVKVSADGATWREAIDVDPATGFVSFPAGALTEGGFRNRLVNGAFTINQRAYVSGATLAANAFGHDRWRAGVSGCVYTFTTPADSPFAAPLSQDVTVTITSGTLLQYVEKGLVEGGDFALTWSGSASAAIDRWDGSAWVSGSGVGASPRVIASVPAGSMLRVVFNTGSVSSAQVTRWPAPAAPERRPASIELRLCQRYFFREIVTFGANGVNAAGCVFLPARMRATPTLGFTDAVGNAGKVSDAAGDNKTVTGGFTHEGGATVRADLVAAASLTRYARCVLTADAEI